MLARTPSAESSRPRARSPRTLWTTFGAAIALIIAISAIILRPSNRRTNSDPVPIALYRTLLAPSGKQWPRISDIRPVAARNPGRVLLIDFELGDEPERRRCGVGVAYDILIRLGT